MYLRLSWIASLLHGFRTLKPLSAVFLDLVVRCYHAAQSQQVALSVSDGATILATVFTAMSGEKKNMSGTLDVPRNPAAWRYSPTIIPRSKWALTVLSFLIVAVFGSPICQSQTNPPGIANIGLPVNGVFSGGQIDSVQLNNGNLHLDIPLLDLPGVGIPIHIHFLYDSKIFGYQTDQSSYTYYVTATPAAAVSYPGFVQSSYASHQNSVTCGGIQYNDAVLDSLTFTDEDRTSHQFPVEGGYMASSPSCDNNPAGTKFYAMDASGIFANRATNTGNFASVITKQGVKYSFPTIGTLPILVEDANGNELSVTSASGGPDQSTTIITDTIGRQVQIIGHFATAYQPDTIQYTDQDGNPQTISIAWTSIPIDTSSLCKMGYTCQGPAAKFWVPSKITLQDNSTTYQFQWYSTGLGDLQSVTLPTGATISYTYVPSDAGGDAVKTRTIVSGGQSSQWTYNYSWNPSQGIGFANTITVNDPYQNDTQYTCTIYAPHPFGVTTNGYHAPCYMTQEKAFNGAASAGNSIVTKTTAYTITGAVMPTSTTVSWTGSGETAETDTSWDVIPNSGAYSGPDYPANDVSWGNMTSKQEYDYGSGSHGALIRNTQYSYLHVQNNAYAVANIADRISQESIYNSSTISASTLVAQTTTNYDQFNQTSINGQTGVVATTGTTNHDYANFGSSAALRGLPTVLRDLET